MTESPAPSRPGHLVLFALFALAFCLRFAVAGQYVAHHPHADAPVIDEAAYDQWGTEIAAGDWIGDEVFFQEPLYPYFLGTVYSLSSYEHGAVRAVQCFLGALAVVLVTLLGARLFGSAAGVLAGLAFAVYRPALLFPSLLLKPNLVLPLLAALALILGATRRAPRPGWLIGVGVLAGLGALLRGNILLLIPVLVLWPIGRAWLGKEERPPPRALAGRAALVALGALLVLAPVALRNYAVGGVLALTTSGAGTNVYGGNNRDNPYGVATEFDWVRGIPQHEAGDWRREAERRAGRALDPGEVSRYWLGEVGRSLRDAPGAHLSILWNKLRLTLGAYEVPDNHHLEWDARYLPLLALPTGGFGLWGTLGIAGVLLFLFGRRGDRSVDRAGAGELALLLALYVGTIVLTVTSMRIRLAIVPWLLPFAGYFMVSAVRSVRRLKDDRSVWRELVALALAGVIVLWPVFDADDEERDLAERDFNLAVQYQDEGRYEEVLALGEGLSQRYPGSVRVENLIASTFFEQGVRLKLQGSVEAGNEQLARAQARIAPFYADPSRVPDAREQHRLDRLAGHLAFERGQYAQAVQALRAALSFDDEEPGDRLTLARAEFAVARALSEQGRADEALATRQRALQILRELAEGDWPTPARAAAHVEAARIQLYLGQTPSACNQLRKAIQLEPRGRTARVQLAHALWGDGENVPAADRLEAERLLVELLEEGEDDTLRSLLGQLQTEPE